MIKINKLAGRWQSFIIGTVGLIGALVTGGNEAVFAQVIPDDTLGAESSVVTPDVLIREILSDRIDGGATRGANLFHSFLEFNIGEGRGVYFANPDGIENILSRVTGDNVSTILGRLGVLGEANLFLLNPNGILFGENASLDIEGSFVATTASGIELGEDGVFSATQPKSSRLLSVSPGALFYNAVEAAGGKITNRGNLTTGRNLTLDGENLDLQGELGSGRDLTLQAQDTVTIRDSETNPFIADAGGNLLVTGNQGIDIFALNHPDSGLFSGGDMVLRSAADVGGDAHYWSGGSFRIEQLDGNLGNLSSPDDPVIRALGDVTLNNYTGASLHIFAGGGVNIGTVTITGADSAEGISEEVTLSDDETVVVIDGKGQPTLDVRAGLDPNAVGSPFGLTGDNVDVKFDDIPDSAEITVDRVFVDAANGVVFLSNQYKPNPSLSGDIQVGSIFTDDYIFIGNAGSVIIDSRGNINITNQINSSSASGDGGAIALTAFDNITTRNLNSFADSSGNGGAISIISTNGSIDTYDLNSYSFSNSGNAGNGGNISLSAANGNISTNVLNSRSRSVSSGNTGNGGTIRLESGDGIHIRDLLFSDSWSNSGNAGNGGDISLSAANDITIDDHAYANSVSSDGGTAANGGTISLVTANGSINTRNLRSDSRSNSGDAGNGGAITLKAANGSIDTDGLRAYSRSNLGNAGNGGDISLESGDGIHIRDSLFSDSWSNSGNAANGGNINLSAANDITIDDHAYAYSLSSDGGTAANGGTISLVTANGSINTRNLSSDSRSDSESAANGGAINLSATNGSINTGNLLSAANSGSGSAGNGGLITLFANGNIITGEIDSQTEGSGNGGNVTLTSTAGEIDTTGGNVTSQIRDNSGGTGNAGTIIFTAKGDIRTATLNSSAESGNGSLIHLTSTNGTIDTTEGDLATDSRSGNAGDIQLDAFGDIIPGEIISTIYSSDPLARGGDITIVSENGVVRVENNHTIRSRTYGAGKGGDINIEAQSIFISNNSRLSTTTFGQGDAGSVNIVAYDTVTVDNDSRVFSQVNTQGEGDGGSINITTGSLSVNTGASLSAPTFGQGNAGSVNIEALDQVSFDRGFVLSRVEQEAVGQGGDINITTGSLSVTNGARLNAGTSGQGNGGRVIINARDHVSFDGFNGLPTAALSNVEPGAKGNSGGVSITAGSLSVTNGALIEARTRGEGNAGNIDITVREQVDFNDSSNGWISGAYSTVEQTATGNGGNINIEAKSISLANRAALGVNTQGQGNAGTINIQSEQLSLSSNAVIGGDLGYGAIGRGGDINLDVKGTLSLIGGETAPTGESTRITLGVLTGGTGFGGELNIRAGSLVLTDGAIIKNSTQGQGDAGDIYINADVVDISGSVPSSGLPSGLFTSTDTTFDAGDIIIDTQTFRIADGAALSARSKGDGQGGDITVNVGSTFEATGGGQLITTTFGQGQAGDIFVNATDQITISGSDPNYANRIAKFPNPIDPFVANGITETGPNSGLFANTEIDSTGNGGNIEIVTTNFNLTDNAQISASTSGSGKGGNLTVTAPEAVTIRGNGQLSVETTGDGAAGNLTIDTQRLNLSDSASISASTSSANPSGVGGNLTINATESFNLTNQASLLAQSTGAAKAGNVTINTEQLTANNGSITTSATATSLGEGGNIDVNASQINLSGNTSGLFAQTQGVAPAGSLTLQPFNNGQTLTINLENNPQISASTSGSGKGGNLTVTAPEAVTIRGNGQLSVETTGDGAAGNLSIDTQRLNISDSASISASTSSANPSGVGGNLTINATESFNLTNQASLLAQSTGAAKAGNVTINTEQLTANNGSITTSATATSLGEGGSIDVNASQINLKGTEIGLLAETEGVAPAGALTLQPFANGQDLTINLQDNAKISAATSGSGEGGSLSVTAPEAITIRGQGQLSVETTGDGAAGNLTIDTQNLTITDGATISASTASPNPEGLGGNLTINATESFTLTNQARILAQSTGAAPAGTITVDTGQLSANNGSIETSATQSAGGAITITASDIRLFGDSDIRTDVASGVGGGGNITLTADTILAFADSDILAFAQDGKGGDITFNTPVFFGFAYAPAPKGTDPDTLDHNGRVDINATGAVEGVITLPDTSAVRNSLTPLSNNQIDTDKLIAESCIARRHEPKRGSFFITGTGGIPFRPGDLYVTPYQTGTVRSIPSQGDGEAGEESSSTRRPWKMGDPIIEPTGIYRLANGELIMGRLCGE